VPRVDHPLVAHTTFGIRRDLEVHARPSQVEGEIVVVAWPRPFIADAAETRLCAWLSASTFVALAAFRIFDSM
jgi:hypothetical protein